MKIHKDSKGNQLNLGDTVTFGNETFEIKEFKLRSTGYVVYNNDNGNAYDVTSVTKLIEEDKSETDKSENLNDFFKRY